MTNLLEKAFDEASKLTPEEQNVLARRLLEELAMEDRWSEALDRSPQTLEALADEALSDHEAGETRPLDASDL